MTISVDTVLPFLKISQKDKTEPGCTLTHTKLINKSFQKQWCAQGGVGRGAAATLMAQLLNSALKCPPGSQNVH